MFSFFERQTRSHLFSKNKQLNFFEAQHKFSLFIKRILLNQMFLLVFLPFLRAEFYGIKTDTGVQVHGNKWTTTWEIGDSWYDQCYHPCKNSWYPWVSDVETVRDCAYCANGGQCCTGKRSKFSLHRCPREFERAAEVCQLFLH